MSQEELNFQSILKKMLNRNLKPKNNVRLTISAVEKGYELETIQKLLNLSPQSKILPQELKEKNINDCLDFAQKIIGKCQNGDNYRLKFELNNEKLTSLNKIFFCLCCYDTLRKDKEILETIFRQNGLEYYYNSHKRLFIIYDSKDINREYCCLYRQKLENYRGGFYIHEIINNFSPQLQLKIWQEYLDLVYQKKKYVFDCPYGFEFKDCFEVEDNTPATTKQLWMSNYRQHCIKLVLLWESRYHRELVAQVKIAEEEGISAELEVEIEKIYFEIVNPDWRSHLEQMKDLGICPDYWLTICVKESPSTLIQQAIDIYRQKTEKRKFVQKPVAYWRYIFNNLDTVTLLNGYRSDCPDGRWYGTLDFLQWGKNADLLVFLTLNCGRYYFSEYHNNSYTPKYSQLNLARDIQVGQHIQIETQLNELGIARIIKAEIAI